MNRRHAFERVSLHALLAMFAAPASVEIVHLIRHEIRVMITRAKDDRLLQRITITGCEQSLKQMLAHSLDTLRHHQPRFE